MPRNAPRAVIVGGGIAGLSAAASLLQQGWSVTVLEQASRFTEVGAGLSITANGLSALASIGLDSVVRAVGHGVHVAGTMDHHGNWLMRIPAGTAPASTQVAYGIHRQQLHGLLLEAAGEARLVTGTRVTGLHPGDPDGAKATVRCETDDGPSVYEADLVVGADGLRSVLRSSLAPANTPTYSGKSSWRGIVDDTALVSDEFVIVWGPGTEFGAVRINAGQVYWYGYTHSPEQLRRPDEKSAAARHFGDWAEPAPALINNTPADRLMRHDVYSLKPPLKTYVYGRTVLIGDAAHAMVPTMGQGANTSLEDGVSVGLLIGRLVNTGTRLTTALAHFDSSRRPRTQGIARRSELVGRMGADLRSRRAIALRNTAMKLVPGGPAATAGGSILSWKAPL